MAEEISFAISLLVSIVSLCHGQGRRGVGGSPFMMSGGGGGGGGIGPYYPDGGGSSYMASGSMYAGGPISMGGGGPTYGGESSHSFGTEYMGSGGPTFDGSFMGPSYMTGGLSYTGGTSLGSGRPQFMSRGSSHAGFQGQGSSGRFASGHRGGVSRSGSTHTSQRGREDGPPREGYIGAYGGRDAFPVHGGYCAGHMCQDGGESAGVGMGYGMGTMRAMDERRRTGRNEDIRTYEMYTGGPGVSGGMGGGGMPPPMGPPPGGPMRRGGLFGGRRLRLF